MATSPEPDTIGKEQEIIHSIAVPKSERDGYDPEEKNNTTAVTESERDGYDPEPKNNKKADAPPPRLRRFPVRALFLIVLPPLLTAFFIVLQTVLTSPEPDAAPYGHRNVKWAFYLWFLLGVWGLGISNYGLKGVEAAMLQHEFWAPRNAKVLSMHVEGTWTSLGGWIRLAKLLIRREGTLPQLVGRLWMLLTTLTLAMYIALPLSGLAIELKDGYVKASGHPKVIGHTYLDYNNREYGQKTARGRAGWTDGAPVALPGVGILYSNADTDRTAHDSLKKLPNSLPLEGGLLDVFLGPQAENPVQGNAWGVRLGYKCDIVKSMSAFTIIRQKPSDLDQSYLALSRVRLSDYPADNIFMNPDNATVTFWNSGVPNFGGTTWAYGETGERPITVDDSNSANYVWRNASTFDEEGLRTHGNVLEIALWQIRKLGSYEGTPNGGGFSFNETLQPTIADMGGPFSLDENKRFAFNESFFSDKLHLATNNTFNLSAIADAPRNSPGYIQDMINNGKLYNNIVSIPPPIGVRCLYQSTPGYADLNPESATFTSFAHLPPKILAANKFPPFGLTMSRILNQTYFDMYTAMDATPIIDTNSAAHTSYVQPDMLLKSAMRAFAMDALQVMYDGRNSFISAYEHENLTSTKPGKILASGDVPVMLPTVLLCIWAAGCVVVGVMYGFERRRAETLGADLAEDIRRGMTPSAARVTKRSDFRDNYGGEDRGVDGEERSAGSVADIK